MVKRERHGGERRDQGGRGGGDEPAADAREDAGAFGALELWPDFVECDQRGGGGERHLEAGRDDGFGLQDHDERHGDGERAEGQRGAVEQLCAEADQGDDVGALGRDLHAGDGEVERAGDDGGERCGLHGGDAQRERFDQRPGEADEEEDHAADQHHVDAGDRQQVREAGEAQGFGVFRRDEAAVAGDHGGGHAAAFLAGGFVDVLGERAADGAEPVEDGVGGCAGGRMARGWHWPIEKPTAPSCWNQASRWNS